MHAGESQKFHETADSIWEMAKEAHDAGYFQLEEALKEVAKALHDKGSGRRSIVDF